MGVYFSIYIFHFANESKKKFIDIPIVYDTKNFTNKVSIKVTVETLYEELL